MAATVTFGLAGEEAPVTVDVAAGGATTLTGNVGPHTVPAGEHHRLVGSVTLTGTLTVHGLLSCDPDVTVDGQGHQITVMDGGRLDFAGVPKTAWTHSGDAADWAPTDEVVDLVPERINLTRSAVFSNLSRVMVHMGAGVQSIKHVRFHNCGLYGQLGFYPIHFHLNADTVRGSLVEGVVVSGSANRAFVPHGSHGVTFTDCIAYDIQGDSYWWDSQAEADGFASRSDDILYLRCVAAKTRVDKENPLINFHRNSAFDLKAGNGNACIECLAVDVHGGLDTGGFVWPERDHSVWLFEDCVAHDCNEGIFVWQNDSLLHDVVRFTGHGNGFRGDIRAGAYNNVYHYIDVDVDRFVLLANSRTVEDPPRTFLIEGGRIGVLRVDHHNLEGSSPLIIRNVDIGAVQYKEMVPPPTANLKSHNRFEDCGLVPADFDMVDPHPDTVAEIFEGGALRHRWANGSWG